jgi:hypothetical protein
MLTEAKTVADEYWSLIQEQEAELTKQRTTIARQKAEIEALVEFAEAELAVNSGIIGFDLHNEAVDRLRSAQSVIHPIIERYRGE